MQIIFWLLFAILIADMLLAAYYQVQIYSNLKIGKGVSVFTGGWMFHPEYLEKDGQRYRKKLFMCFTVFLLLVIALSIVSRIAGNV